MSPRGSGLARKTLGTLLSSPRHVTGVLRSRWVERDPKLWVVGSAFGVADGALAFAKAAAALPDPPRLVWLSASPGESDAARAAGIAHVVDRDSRQGYVLTLQAGLAAITHGFGDVNRHALTGAVVVQLWPGAPLTKLRATPRHRARRISLLPTGSGFFVPFLAGAFGLLHGQVQVLGEPRADVLFSGTPDSRRAAARALLRPHLGDHPDARVVLYAPAWRDGEPDPGVPTELQWHRIEEVCERLDLVLLLHPHPSGEGGYTRSSARVRLLTATRQPEVIPLLWGLDALVTDYSPIAVDFVAIGKPLLLLAPDLESYRRTHGLHLDYGWLAGGSWSTDWDQVLDHLEAVLEDPEVAAAAAAHSNELAAKFHEWTDGRSATRVAEAAADLVRKRFR